MMMQHLQRESCCSAPALFLLLLVWLSLFVEPSHASFVIPKTQQRFYQLHETSVRVVRNRGYCLKGRQNDDDLGGLMKGAMTTSSTKNPLYDILSNPEDPLLQKQEEQPSSNKNKNNFYNDEVISHLHGYMLLVGLFAAQDELFLISFFGWAIAAAAGTLAGILPANPRVPALVAILTFLSTITIRFGFQMEPILVTSSSFDYRGPADSALAWETGICALNVLWGLVLWKSFASSSSSTQESN